MTTPTRKSNKLNAADFATSEDMVSVDRHAAMQKIRACTLPDLVRVADLLLSIHVTTAEKFVDNLGRADTPFHRSGAGDVGFQVAADILIAIVDDDRSLRTSLVRLVHSMGYIARGFASAEEFIESDALDQLSCLITDIQMPGMSGIELTKIVVARYANLPVIMVTARSEPNLEESAIANGALFFLRKPIDTNLLVESLTRALGN